MPTHPPVPTAGETMPILPLIAPDGGQSTLSEAQGGRRSVVLFMRASDCPICVAHGRTILRMQAAGELGDAGAIFVTPGGSAEATSARRRLGSGAAVFASGDHHADIGLGRFLTIQHSGTFVLDEHGRVLDAVTSTLPTGAFSKARALAALAS
ncbi:MAG: hypothetical protein ABIO06_01975 [Pseudolysinimonas sp.]